MKLFSGIFGLLLLAFVVSFALSNRQAVDVGLWPLAATVSVPSYLLGLAPLAFGLMFGGLWGWLYGIPHRLRARRLGKELVALNDKINDLQKNTPVQPAKQKSVRPFWRLHS